MEQLEKLFKEHSAERPLFVWSFPPKGESLWSTPEL